MSDDQPPQPDPHHPAHVPLNVINASAKVEQLRKEAAAASAPASAEGSAPAKHVDTTLVTRFCDQNKTPGQKSIEEKVVDALKTVYDPEIPVNIYDLGLIYRIDVNPESCEVEIRMTLTAPGCPVAGEIINDVRRRVQGIKEVPEAHVELVWDPPWTREMMSEAAQLELGLL